MKLLTIKDPTGRSAIRQAELPVTPHLSPREFLKTTSLDVGHDARLSNTREQPGVLDAGIPASNNQKEEIR